MMETTALWEMYRKAVRKMHTLEQQYKAESENEKEYVYLTYTELNTHYGIVNGIRECLEELEPDKYAVGKRAFDIWCEETDVPKVRGGKFGFWIPVEKELPEHGTDVLASFNDGGVEMVFYGRDWPVGCDKVIAWMPLPEAYKHDKDGEE